MHHQHWYGDGGRDGAHQPSQLQEAVPKGMSDTDFCTANRVRHNGLYHTGIEVLHKYISTHYHKMSDPK